MDEKITVPRVPSNEKKPDLNDLSTFEDESLTELPEEPKVEENTKETEEEEENEEEETIEEKNSVPYSRFKEVNEKYKRYRKELEDLKMRLEEKQKEETKEIKELEEVDELGKEDNRPKKLNIDDLDMRLDEREFFKKIGISNKYDQEKLKNTTFPIAKVILESNKADSYLEALYKAYNLDSIKMDSDKDNDLKASAKVEALGTVSGSKSTENKEDTALTKDQIMIAREMGIPLKEYRKYI